MMTCTPIWRDPAAFQSGDILGVARIVKWWNPKHFFSWRIQADTKSPYNHVGMLEWYAGEWHVIEALWKGGLVRRPLKIYANAKYRLTVGEWTLDRAHRRSAANWLKVRIGAPYDKWKIVKLRLLQIVLGVDSVRRMLTGENDDALICSESVIRAIRETGPALFDCGDYAGPGSVMRAVADGAYRWWDGKAWTEAPWG